MTPLASTPAAATAATERKATKREASRMPGHELRMHDLSCGYDSTPVLEHIDLTLESGQVTCLLGPNGSGKTTLFKTLLGFLKPLGGAIELDGENLEGWSRKRYGREFGYIPQLHSPSFSFTVLEVVLMGRTPHLGAFGNVGQTDREIAHQALDELGLGHLASRDYTTLSGGERQMVLVARVLAQQPAFLVMDEPTSALDLGNQARVLECVQDLARRGFGVLMTTHDPNQAFLLEGAVVCIGRSGLLACGKAADVLDEELLARMYGWDVKLDAMRVGGRTVASCIPVLAARDEA